MADDSRYGPAMSFVILLLLPLACDGDDVETEPASISFLVPTEGESYPAGELTLSLVVENFSLVAPKHNDGEAEGYIEIVLDDDGAMQTDSTTPTITLDEVGEHTLTAGLFYSDGDAVEPAATAEVSFLAE